METKLTLTQWIARQKSGAFDAKDVHTQIEAGWYDWFCSDKALAGKTRLLAPKVARIARSSKINPETTYVFFKNNCPMIGSLYDDFRICDIETGNVIWTIIPRSGHTSAHERAELWGRENNFTGPILTGTLLDIYNYFAV